MMPPSPKAELYDSLLPQLRALLEGEPDFIANAANMAALVYHGLPELNWAGFYLLRGEQLVLGPFQGKPACRRIELGKGVLRHGGGSPDHGRRGKRPRFSGPYRLRRRFALGDRGSARRRRSAARRVRRG